MSGIGVGGVIVAFRFADIPTGLFNLVFVEEIQAGVYPLDPRGSWALGYPAAGGTLRHGVVSDDEGDAGLNNQSQAADDLQRCIQLRQTIRFHLVRARWLTEGKDLEGKPAYRPRIDVSPADISTIVLVVGFVVVDLWVIVWVIVWFVRSKLNSQKGSP